MCLIWISVFLSEGSQGNKLPIPCMGIMWCFLHVARKKALKSRTLPTGSLRQTSLCENPLSAPFRKGTLVGGESTRDIASLCYKVQGRIFLPEDHSTRLTQQADFQEKTKNKNHGPTPCLSIYMWQGWWGAARQRCIKISDARNMVPNSNVKSAPKSCPAATPSSPKGHLG